MKTRAAFQLRSFGTLPRGARRTITAAATLVTAFGGLGKAFSSVRLTWRKAQTPWRPGEGWRSAGSRCQWPPTSPFHTSPGRAVLCLPPRNSTLRLQEVQFSLGTLGLQEIQFSLHTFVPDALETSLSFFWREKWFIWYSTPTEPCTLSQDIS